MKLSVKSLTTGLNFHGEVEGKRQHYYILSSENPRAFLQREAIAGNGEPDNIRMQAPADCRWRSRYGFPAAAPHPERYAY